MIKDLFLLLQVFRSFKHFFKKFIFKKSFPHFVSTNKGFAYCHSSVENISFISKPTGVTRLCIKYTYNQEVQQAPR